MTTYIDPTVPTPQQALPPEARQAAYMQLLGQATGRNDNGDSSQVMADILNRADMGRADRLNTIYGNRLTQYVDSGKTMLNAVGDANAALRAKWGARGGGGGGRSSAPRKATVPTTTTVPQESALDAYIRSLSGPTVNTLGAGQGRSKSWGFGTKPGGYGKPTLPKYNTRLS